MSNTLIFFPENEKIDNILNRIEEIKKFLKIFRGFLNDHCLCFDNFGKSMSKSAKTLVPATTNPLTDPSLTRQLSTKLFSFEDAFGKIYSLSFTELNASVNQILDDFTNRVELARRRIFDNSSVAIKNLSICKTNYMKLKAKYEKAAKEAELVFSQRKKTLSDPLKAYSLTTARKLSAEAKSTITYFLATEEQFRESVDAANTKQFAFNIALQDSFNTFKLLYGLLLDKVLLLMQKGNETFTKIIEAFSLELELKSGLNLEDLAQVSSDQEEEYAEERRPQDATYPKGIYTKIAKIALEDPNSLQEAQLQSFSEAASKHIESSVGIIEERMKLFKTMKNVMNDISAANEQLSKTIQKVTKNFQLSGFSSVFMKHVTECASKYYLAVETLAKKYSILSNFLNLKGGTFDVIAKELATGLKTYHSTCQKILKDHAQVRTSYLNGLNSLEKLSKKLSDAEKEKNEAKIAQLKQDLETSQQAFQELKQNMKNSVIEAATGIRKAGREYREYESIRVKGACSTLQMVIVNQQNTTNDLQEASKVIEESCKMEETTLDDEVEMLLEQDEQIFNDIKRANLGIGDAAFDFQQLFTPPEDILQELKRQSEKDESPHGKAEKEEVKEEPAKNGEDRKPADQESWEVSEREKTQGSVPKELEETFGLGPKDRFITDFSCALKQNILQQGRLYVLTTKLCFSSSLSSEVLVIPVADVLSVEKRVNALIFDNAISIKTVNGEIVFASFFTRDKAFQVLTQLLKDPQALELEYQAKTASPKSGNSRTLNKHQGGSRSQESSPARSKASFGLDALGVSLPRKPDRNGKYHIREASFEETLHEESPRHSIEEDLEARGQVALRRSQSARDEGVKLTNSFVEEIGKGASAEPDLKTIPSTEASSDLRLNPEETEKLAQRKLSILEGMISSEQFEKEIFRCTYENTTLPQFFRALLTDECWVKGTQDSAKMTPWEALRAESESKLIEREKWTPPAPKLYRKGGRLNKKYLAEFMNSSYQSKRVYKYTHPVKDQNIFSAESFITEEYQTLFWVHIDELVVQTECIASGAPNTETFKTKNCLIINQLPDSKVSFVWKITVEFIKTTPLESAITNLILNEAEEFAQDKLGPLIGCHLKVIQEHDKSKIQKKGSKNPEIPTVNGGSSSTKDQEPNTNKPALQGSEPAQDLKEEIKDEHWDYAAKEKIELFEARKTRQYQQITPLEKYPEQLFMEVFEDCTVPDIFQALFSDQATKYKGKAFDTPWHVLKVESGDTDISYTPWTPSAPTMFAKNVINETSIKELLEFEPISKRSYKFVHPLNQGVFAPKTATVEERQTIHWLGVDEIVVQTEIHLSKVPYSDCFLVKNIFQVKQVEETKVLICWRGWVDILKNFMFKGKAQKDSVTEMNDFNKKIFTPFLNEVIKITQLKNMSRRKSLQRAKKEAEQLGSLQNLSTDIRSSKQHHHHLSADFQTNTRESTNMLNDQEEEIEIEEEVSEIYVISSDKLDSLRERAERIRKQCIPSDKFITNIFKETLDAGIFEVFSSVFSEAEIKASTGECYKNSWEKMRKLMEDTNLESNPFQPSFPKYYATGEFSEESINELLTYPDKSERQTRFTHPVRGQGMFAPKSCTVIEKFTIYWLNHEEVIVQLQVSTENVMYCDTFVTRTNYHFKQLEDGKCLLEYSMFVDFIKSTMFKGMILKSSTDEVTETGLKKLLPSIKENIGYFAKQKPPPSSKLTKKKKKIKRKVRSGDDPAEEANRTQPTIIVSKMSPNIRDSGYEEDVMKVSKEEMVMPVREEKISQSREDAKKDDEMLNRIILLEKKQESLSQEVKILRLALIIAISINFIGFAFWFR